jgi:hypothetical protein
MGAFFCGRRGRTQKNRAIRSNKKPPFGEWSLRPAQTPKTKNPQGFFVPLLSLARVNDTKKPQGGCIFREKRLLLTVSLITRSSCKKTPAGTFNMAGGL